MVFKTSFIKPLLQLAPLLLILAMAGCALESQSTPPSSGDPQADRRAEERVKGDKTKGAAPRTLYDRLGGDQGIRAIVDDLTTRVLADPRVNFERKDVKTHWYGGKYDAWNPTPADIQHLKDHLTQFIALAAGGPSQYTGRDMAATHRGMRITNNEFDAMVGDIKASMDRLAVPLAEQRDLLAIIETTRKEIVEVP